MAASGSGEGKSKKGLWYALIVIIILVIAFIFGRGLLSAPVEVKSGVVTNVFPSQANSVLTASGYVVASRKAAVGSKGTGRLVYLGVEEGSHVKQGQIIGRLESADVFVQYWIEYLSKRVIDLTKRAKEAK